MGPKAHFTKRVGHPRAHACLIPKKSWGRNIHQTRDREPIYLCVRVWVPLYNAYIVIIFVHIYILIYLFIYVFICLIDIIILIIIITVIFKSVANCQHQWTPPIWHFDGTRWSTSLSSLDIFGLFPPLEARGGRPKPLHHLLNQRCSLP